jgi:hypothetical protein
MPGGRRASSRLGAHEATFSSLVRLGVRGLVKLAPITITEPLVAT